ncbi:VPLPA-CTERM sorting domain-containing protein [Rubellimicrobium aerolatum]|uniref:VPLPA-CTERM sorting domain-containing protein n=1 Tax=Rubellimicrobium aerolatum TaxID=490979 RepID=A0ABW0SGA9_9RHOB|nr:VPLPA-CTERM sorting domain-containing protein [Rubellimicrobium aerolatum]MBP1807332.1 hypothetical protein [Rubellimicrobium aerolatum]
MPKPLLAALAFAATAGLAPAAQAATIDLSAIVPADATLAPLAAHGFASAFGGLYTLATPLYEQITHIAFFDTPDSVDHATADFGVLAAGWLTSVGLVDGVERFTGSLLMAPAIIADGAYVTGYPEILGQMDFAADGTWTCSGPCATYDRDPETGDLLITAGVITTGTYGLAAAPSAVPLPASAPLLALGLAGLAALRRRRA